jgi:hypothetical protein
MFGRNHRNQGAVEKSRTIGRVALCAAAIGAIATGAFAVGALAIGAVAIGRLVLGCGHIKHLEIDELTVGKLKIREQLRD